LATLIKHESQDVDDQAKALNGWQQTYEQLGRGRFRGVAQQLVMAEGVLLREQTNRKIRETIRPPPDHLVLAVPLAVEPGSVFAGRPLERESLMLLSSRNEYDIVSAGELDLIGVSVHRDVVARLAPAKVQWLEDAMQVQNLSLSPQAASAIRHMLLAVCGDSEDRLDSLAGGEADAELLSSTLTQTVMLAMLGDGIEHRSTVPRRSEARLAVVRRAIDFMHAKLNDDIGIPEMCEAAYASRRTLQYCFEEFMRTTPQAYLRALRLNEARRALKNSGGRAITTLAGEFGFNSASHFTRHYKLMFGELPSQTLKLHPLGSGS
jgi:AraC family transcriptional regulator, ethanolamine operon transcriptional activator